VQLGEIHDTGVVVMLLHLRNYLAAIKAHPGMVLLLMNLQLALIILQQTGTGELHWSDVACCLSEISCIIIIIIIII
jgi:hypothetical protein